MNGAATVLLEVFLVVGGIAVIALGIRARRNPDKTAGHFRGGAGGDLFERVGSRQDQADGMRIAGTGAIGFGALMIGLAVFMTVTGMAVQS